MPFQNPSVRVAAGDDDMADLSIEWIDTTEEFTGGVFNFSESDVVLRAGEKEAFVDRATKSVAAERSRRKREKQMTAALAKAFGL